jgi:hypothetical protein
MRDITPLMNSYRECSRNLWNVYFSGRPNVGESLDFFRQIKPILFDSLVVGELYYLGDAKDKDIPPPFLQVVPKTRAPLLVRRPSDDGNLYWDQEKDLTVGPDDIVLAFLDYFDFSQIPTMDLQFYRCKILSFASRAGYEGREALIQTVDGLVFHNEERDSP